MKKYKIIILSLFSLFFLSNKTFAQIWAGGNISTASRTISCPGPVNFYDDGGNAGSYTNSKDYTLTVTAGTAGQCLTVSFTSFSTESCCDNLKIYNGVGTGGTLFGTYAGTTVPPNATSTAGSLTFVFHSDGSVVNTGWVATIACSACAPPPPPSTNMNNTNVSLTCPTSLLFYDSGGSGGTYSASETFTKTFTASAGSCVSYTFNAFNTESCCDRLSVYDGASSASPLVGTYAGTTLPPNFTASGTSLTFVFTSDGSVQNAGWTATVSCANACSGSPTAGTAAASPTAQCGTFTTTLSLTGASAGCGITYQWYQSNASAGTYTAVGSISSTSTQTYVVSATTYFKCVILCGASSSTTSVISANIDPLSAGVGSYSVTLPYSATGLTNCGAGDDITSTNVSATCGSTSYLGGEDAVYIFSPTVTTAFSGSLTSSSSWVGMTLYQGCPTSTGVCVDYAQSSSGNQSITSCTNVLTAGLTYYLIVDAFPSPTCHPTYALNLSMNGCSGMPTAGTAVASPSINCASFTTTLSLTGSTSGCGLTYQWFYSNAAAGTYTAISASSSTSTQTFVVTGTTYFKGVVTCGASSATTSAIMALVSPTNAGVGSYSVALPYSITGQTTCGSGNDITSSNVANICGSSSYYTGEDVVYVFTPTTTAIFNATVTSTGSYTGLMLYNGCPTGTGVCVANNQSSTGTKTLSAPSGTCATSATVTAGTTYFLVLDSYAAPACNPYDLAIGTTPISSSTVAPCNLNYTAASTTYSFENFTGTSLPTTDDVLFNAYISLGFPFCFDGTQYTGGYVASNSSFVFDAVPCFPNIQTTTYAAGGVSTGYTISGAAPLNGTSVPRNAILAPWHDINPASSATVAASKIQYQVTGTSPNRKAVISWENIPMYSGACETVNASRASSQVKIFEFDGSIEIHIKNKQVCSTWNGGDAILGLHNYNGTLYVPPVNATAHNFPTDWTMTNTAYKFTTSCSSSGSCLTVLPIGFKDFYGDRIDHVNTLFWSTATEENMDYFIIERSNDGINFIDIGKVMAKNTPSSYTYKDFESMVGMINYYRIRAVEKNSEATTTKIISISESDDELLSTWPIYPNPSNTEINIRLNSKINTRANILIYDVIGKVAVNQTEDIKVGVKVYSVDISSLQSGIYFVEIKNDINEIISKQKLIRN